MAAAWSAGGQSQRLTRGRLVAAALLFLAIFSVFWFWEELPSVPAQLKDFKDTQLCSSLSDASPLTVTVTLTSTADAVDPTKPAAAQSTTQASPTRPAGCVDHYRSPGYLFVDPSRDYNETRWVPYTDTFFDAPPPASAHYPHDKAEGEVWFDVNSRIEGTYLDGAQTPKQWMNFALEEARSINQARKRGEMDFRSEGRLEWLRGRVVLLVSDSVDRYNARFFCYEFRDRGADTNARYFGGEIQHTWAQCHIPSLNLTLLHWHLPGMMTYSPDWWSHPVDRNPVPFEERFEQVWSETSGNLTSIDGAGPDLVLWQSNLWDGKAWFESARNHYKNTSTMLQPGRALVWDEIRFFSARVKVLLGTLRDRFGAQTPFMLRTMTYSPKTPQKDLQAIEMDHVNRFLSQRFDMESFEWGRLIAGHTELYQDGMHPGQGAASWLWATMILEYLARAARAGTAAGSARAPYFDGWSSCHKHLVGG